MCRFFENVFDFAPMCFLAMMLAKNFTVNLLVKQIDALSKVAVEMKEWIIKVLPLWLADIKEQFGDEHIVPLLILDAYKCHMDGNNVRMIQDLGIELLIIPGGCTYLCQPLDVGVNRSLKVSVKSQWDDWMESEGAVTLQKPSRELIGKWVLKAWDDLDAQTVRNSWKKTDFEWVL